MFGERRGSESKERTRTLFLAAAALIGLGFPEVARAEAPESETIADVERLGDPSLATHVEGEAAVQQRAQECKAAYDSAKALRSDANVKDAVWIVIDTAIGGSSARDHVEEAKGGVAALKACFEGTGEHPRIIQLLNGEAKEPGVTMQPIDGTALSNILVEAEGAAADGAQALERSLTLDLGKDDPTLKDIRRVVTAPNPREVLGSIDSVTMGYSAVRTTDSGHVWEYNGQLGMLRGDETGVVARGSAGLQTLLSPVEGGRTTVGIAAELSRSNGNLDASAGSYLLTSLGDGRPDLVLSTTVSPADGRIEVQNQMALRFSQKIFSRGG